MRNLFHMGGSIIPLSYLYFGKLTALYFTLCLLLLVSLFEIARIRGYFEIPHIKRLLKPNEYRRPTGSFYFLLGSALSIVIYGEISAVLSLFVLSLSDPLAQIVGNILKGPKILSKSVSGSTAFYLSTFLILKIGGVPLLQCLLISFISTLTEILSKKLDDNLTIPLVTGFFLEILLT